MAAFLEPEVLLKEDNDAEKYLDLEKLIFGSSQVIDLDEEDPLAVTAEDIIRAIKTPDPIAAPSSQPSLATQSAVRQLLVPRSIVAGCAKPSNVGSTSNVLRVAPCQYCGPGRLFSLEILQQHMREAHGLVFQKSSQNV